ncbi:hypothetical protein M405DRAFT_806695 [Rhizopogon salebrosus TDB-379]|nr:hypothetical protein M405DRAFT_806695 [Rhizopogon salebrosus TDB-379]
MLEHYPKACLSIIQRQLAAKRRRSTRAVEYKYDRPDGRVRTQNNAGQTTYATSEIPDGRSKNV